MKQTYTYIGIVMSILTIFACGNRNATHSPKSSIDDSIATAITKTEKQVVPLDTFINYTAPISDSDVSIDLSLNIQNDTISGSFCYNHEWEYSNEVTGIHSAGKIKLYYLADNVDDETLFLEGSINNDSLLATMYYYEGETLLKEPLFFSTLTDEMIGQIETQKRIEAMEAETKENQRRIEVERNRKAQQSQLHMFKCTRCGTIEYTERSTDRPKQSNEYCDRQKGITFHNWQWVKRVY